MPCYESSQLLSHKVFDQALVVCKNQWHSLNGPDETNLFSRSPNT